MRKIAGARAEEQGWELVFEQVRKMALELSNEEFFQKLEVLIDSARRELEGIPEPQVKAEIHKNWIELIDYALSLKVAGLLDQKLVKG